MLSSKKAIEAFEIINNNQNLAVYLISASNFLLHIHFSSIKQNRQTKTMFNLHFHGYTIIFIVEIYVGCGNRDILLSASVPEI